MASKFCFAIDRGGTFTDVYAKCPDGKISVLKLLSEDPMHYDDAPTEGIRRILGQEEGCLLETKDIEWIRMGTTVATNALLERKGERMALAVTKGFRDILHIGNQSRPNIFDLKVSCPSVLYEDVIEIDERVIPRQDETDAEIKSKNWVEKFGVTKESLLVTKSLNCSEIEQDLKRVLTKGISSLSVLLLHSYMYPEHELVVKSIAEKVGFKHVSVSCIVMPMVKAVPRGYTACSDAYLTPHIKTYLQGFRSGFKNQLEGVNVLFMQSDGGLTRMQNFCGSRAILSGPAGGVVGYAMTTCSHLKDKPVIGFDMGGTSTDVSRYDGKFEHVFESTTAGVIIQAPQLDINTVAAGGGSRLFFRAGMFVVGPESAGAHPGPVCYKKGGPLAVTDCNLALGRLLPEYFPKIFGPNENEAVDREATLKAFRELTAEIDSYEGKGRTQEEVAMGFIRVANEAMCRPIRALTQAKGYDTSRHVLSVFGGAGGQHACAIARSLGMTKVFVHKYAGILSAYGMALADVVHEAQEPCAKTYVQENLAYLEARIKALQEECIDKLKAQGFSTKKIVCEPYLNLRYEGTDFALMCMPVHSQNKECYINDVGDFQKAFFDRYQQEFGFTIKNRSIIVDDVRVRGVGKSDVEISTCIKTATEPATPCTGIGVKPWYELTAPADLLSSGQFKHQPHITSLTVRVADVYFEDRFHRTKVYILDNLLANHKIIGPSIIMDNLSTILIEPDCVANITNEGDVEIDVMKTSQRSLGTQLDTIQLSIFSHRFMSLAEQMGRILQRTSVSTNIKERLDFSCALFGMDGGLVSNAPHIPVHLGAMQEAVQYQISAIGSDLKDGDVILSNHPTAGGSHLPDLTVITPVFRKINSHSDGTELYRGIDRPVFYVASRGHHADIGGITPGSMPPHSTSIFQEGAVFMSFKLVESGKFQEEKLIELLMAPAKYPGSSGTRNLPDNLSDLRAQVAANHKGILLVNELISEYGLEVIQAYMGHIQSSAESAVKEMLSDIGRKVKSCVGSSNLEASDYMDDGSLIHLSVIINDEEGTAEFDFSKTGPEVWGNCNAPRAITVSALIYCLRCMVGHNIPLNQGCLKPIKLVIPIGSILNPSPEAAVVGGNVQTSQRVVDVIFKAFGACAASQGCMNNITFGDQSVGYYETVAGGAGAGPSWHGRSGVHSHMTNTRITDPEILERRYPVFLKKFTLNPNTGGKGQFNGGDGVIRELEFRRDLTLSILTERRVFSPYGLEGGQDGKKGNNLLIRKCGKKIRLQSKASVEVFKGDTFLLTSPGGGGYGCDKNTSPNRETSINNMLHVNRLRGSLYDYTMAQESA